MLSLFKKNLLLVIVILVGVSGFLLPHVSEAKSVQWSIVESNDLAYYWNNGQAGATGWDKGLSAPIISVQYQANVYDNNTNALISDGASIPVGTTVRFQPTTYNDCDITWFASGFTQDSPCGHWISGAAAPTFS